MIADVIRISSVISRALPASIAFIFLAFWCGRVEAQGFTPNAPLPWSADRADLNVSVIRDANLAQMFSRDAASRPKNVTLGISVAMDRIIQTPSASKGELQAMALSTVVEPLSIRMQQEDQVTGGIEVLVTQSNGARRKLDFISPKVYRGVVVRGESQGSEQVVGSATASIDESGKLLGSFSVSDGFNKKHTFQLQGINNAKNGTAEFSAKPFSAPTTAEEPLGCGVSAALEHNPATHPAPELKSGNSNSKADETKPQPSTTEFIELMSAPPAGMRDLQIATDMDCRYVAKYGGVEPAILYLLSVYALLEPIYKAQLNIVPVLSFIHVWESCSAPGYPYSSVTNPGILGKFSTYWQANFSSTKVYDVAHLHAEYIDAAYAGIAYFASACTPARYAVSLNSWYSDQFNDVTITAHEIGHNLGAVHDDCTSSFWVMCGSGGGYIDQFSGLSKTDIARYISGVSCITPSTTSRSAPAFSVPPSLEVREGEKIDIPITVTDADGDLDRIVATSLPVGATYTNGRLQWNPSTATISCVNEDTFFARFTAVDVTNRSSNVVIPIRVVNQNSPPIITAPTYFELVDPKKVSIQIVDPDGDNFSVDVNSDESGPRPEPSQVYGISGSRTIDVEFTRNFSFPEAPGTTTIIAQDCNGAETRHKISVEQFPLAGMPRVKFLQIDSLSTFEDQEVEMPFTVTYPQGTSAKDFTFSVDSIWSNRVRVEAGKLIYRPGYSTITRCRTFDDPTGPPRQQSHYFQIRKVDGQELRVYAPTVAVYDSPTSGPTLFGFSQYQYPGDVLGTYRAGDQVYGYVNGVDSDGDVTLKFYPDSGYEGSTFPPEATLSLRGEFRWTVSSTAVGTQRIGYQAVDCLGRKVRGFFDLMQVSNDRSDDSTPELKLEFSTSGGSKSSSPLVMRLQVKANKPGVSVSAMAPACRYQLFAAAGNSFASAGVGRFAVSENPLVFSVKNLPGLRARNGRAASSATVRAVLRCNGRVTETFSRVVPVRKQRNQLNFDDWRDALIERLQRSQK